MSGPGLGSAGLLVFRRRHDGPEFLLVHPGGPFWSGKNLHAWSFPKGRIGPNEQPLAAAQREFREETGLEIDDAALPLTPVRRSAGGYTFCWLVEADLDLAKAQSNSFELKQRQGPPRLFPEIDAYAYCTVEVALLRIHRSLLPILEEACAQLGVEFTRRCPSVKH